MAYFVVAYCGPAAVPADLWLRWNTDPLLLAALAALSLIVAIGRCADRQRTPTHTDPSRQIRTRRFIGRAENGRREAYWVAICR